MKRFFSVFFVLCLLLSLILITASASKALTFKAGTYSASAQGHNGEVVIEMSFSDEAVTDVKITEHNETIGIADLALEKIPEAIVKAQTLAIDSVSGATMTSEAIIKSALACVEQAGGDADKLLGGKRVRVSSDNHILNDVEVDVLIIGGGGAGLSAAVSAAEEGARVILVEKTDSLGGNTLRSGGVFNTYDPEGQKDIPMNESLASAVEAVLNKENTSSEQAELKAEVQKQWDEYRASGRSNLFDSPEWHALQSLDAGDNIGNVSLMRTLTTHSLETKKWLTNHGVAWLPEIRTVVGALWNRSSQPVNKSGADIVAALKTAAETSGVDVYFNSKAENLITKDDRVVGAIITNALGEKVTVLAKKGVVLATGGFGANIDMRVRYNKHWADLSENIKTNNHPGATGDGIVMGEAIGAHLVDMEWIQLIPLHPVSGGGISGYVNNAVYVNQEGNRYVAEDERRDVLSQSALDQTNSVFYVVNDQAEVDRVGVPEETIKYMVANGLIYSSDTIEGLAEEIGAEPENMVATIGDFNKSVESGKDLFDRRTFDQKISVPPFYAASFSPAVHHTMGGLEINVNAQVIDSNGEVISGFFAAGEVTGNIHGTNRVGGNAVPDALVFGKIAGLMAARGE